MAAEQSLTEADLVGRLRAAGCVLAEREAALLLTQTADPVELEAMVARRVEGLPLEHVLGWAEFAGLRLAVDPGVFVPRHRTELLARRAVALARSVPGRPVVLDLCCGVGALAAVMGTALPTVELYAADADPAATRCARRNLAPFGAPVYEGDLFEPLPETLRGRVDVLVANVPYVPTAAIALMPVEARQYEARVALDGGGDGLDVLRRVVRQAPTWLAPEGALLVETSQGQAPAALEAVGHAGLTASVVTDDEDEDVVVVLGTTPAR